MWTKREDLDPERYPDPCEIIMDLGSPKVTDPADPEHWYTFKIIGSGPKYIDSDPDTSRYQMPFLQIYFKFCSLLSLVGKNTDACMYIYTHMGIYERWGALKRWKYRVIFKVMIFLVKTWKYRTHFTLGKIMSDDFIVALILSKPLTFSK